MSIFNKRIFGFAAVVFGILVSATAVAHTDGIYNPTANSVGDTQGIDSNGAAAVTPVAFVLDGSGTTNSSIASYTIPLTTSNGSGLIVVCIGSNNVTAVSSVTASGLTFTLRTTTAVNGGDKNTVYTAPYSSNFSGNITVNQGGAPAFSTSTAFGISGVHTASPFDGSAVIGTTSTVAITTTNANTFIYAMYGSATGNPGAGSGWTAINSSNFWITEYQIVSATQAGLTATTLAGSTLSGVIDAVVKGP